MPTNNTPPSGWGGYFIFFWVLILSIWGGTVHTIIKIKEGAISSFTFREWIMNIIISSFIGVLVYAMCKATGSNEWITAVVIGISSYQGTRGLRLIETWIKKYDKKL